MLIDPIRRTVKLAILHVLHLIDESRRRRIDGPRPSVPLHRWSLSANDDGHLVIGGCDAVELARRYGTPLHIVDEASLVRTFQAFRDAFLHHYPRIEVGYSYKTNPLPGVLAALHRAGASAEVISHFELWLALRLGMPGERIIFNGPAKTQEALALAVSNQVRLINIDNLDEPRVIHGLAETHGRRQAVGVRVVPSVGWAGQFGLNIRSGAALAAFRQILALDRLIPCGVHVHLGTGIKSLDIYATALEEVLEFTKSVERELGIKVEFLDFGGGFGVPTVKPYSVNDVRLMANGFPPTVLDPDAHPALDTFAGAVSELVNRYYPQSASHQPTIILEPGRAITSSAQTLVLSVLAVKDKAGGHKMVITDGGKNIAMPTGYEHHQLLAASRLDRPATITYDVFGPLCHPGDMLFRAVNLPPLEPGDLLGIMDAGAYFIPNQTNFSNPRPAAVMVRQGEAEVIRRRETFDHVIALDDCG
jgi:diaminopimelate decarboxylase